MELADLIINQGNTKNENGEDLHEYCDDLGICTLVKDPNDPVELRSDPKYYSIRIRVLNYRKYRERKQGLIHKRGGLLYIGNEPIKQDDKTLFMLVKSRTPIPMHIKAQIWDDLYENVPTLSNDKIIVSDDLFYDKITGELEHQDGSMLSTGFGDINNW